MKLRIATCRALPEPDPDAAPLAAALADAGVDATWLAWDDPAADWDAPIPTLLRSTWNYPLHLDAFLAWLVRAAAAAPLVNPLPVCRTNIRKRYLLELAARGVPTVPTTLVERGATLDLAALAAPRIVIKPEIGAASLDTAVFSPSDPAAARHLAALAARGAALVQPYVRSVDDYGERALVWIDGALSHAVRKTPRFAGDIERVTGPFDIADDERDVALAALAALAPYPDLLYARVDLARDDAGRPMVMELELVEPSLFFAHRPDSAAHFAAALARRLA
jgi:glutathione synthase/RimK-type ligase-like ATP-grasp enzyme